MGRIYIKLIVFILLLSVFFYSPQNDNAQAGPTYITMTTLDSNTIWNTSGSPYIIMDNITVPVGIWLWILPGVEVRFERDMRLWIYGTLYAIGNESDPIVFTSNKTDPGPGNWATIRIEEEANSSVSEIRNCRIEYSVIGVNAEGSSPIIMNNTFENIYSEGISLDDSEAYIAGNTINNSLKGIEAEYSNPTIEDNAISNFMYYGMRFFQSSPILRNNTISGGLTGIELKKSVAQIERNMIFDTKYGIELDSSHYSVIENTSLSDNDYGIYSVNSKGTNINDCSLSQNNKGFYSLNSTFYLSKTITKQSEDFDFFLKENSKAQLVESEFDLSKVQIQDTSYIEVFNYLIVKVENETGEGYEGAEVDIQDNSELVYTLFTDQNGTTDSVLIVDRWVIEGGAIIENITSVNVSYTNKLFADNPRNVDMSYSHTEIFVRVNMDPNVNFTNPNDMQRVNGTVNITGTAFDQDGNITNVILRINEGSWQSVNDTGGNWSSWSYEWNTATFADGYYTIQVNATDNEQAVSISGIIAIVDNLPNSPPSVNITSHQDKEVVNYTVFISGYAHDYDGKIKVVQIKIDDGPWQDALKSNLDWSTWIYNWDSTLYSEGEHVIKVRSIDDEDSNSTIENITLVVNNLDNIPPMVNLVSHISDEEVSGEVILKGESSDSDGIVKVVEIQIDDGAWQLTMNTGMDYSTWEFEWETTQYLNGEHELRLRAIDDELATSRINTIILIVNNGGNMPPTVEITSHIDGVELCGLVKINGKSKDTDGFVELVQIQVDSNPWKNATNIGEQWSLWSFNLDTIMYSNGEHVINARSKDNSSAYSAVESIIVTINNGGNMPPIVYITSHNDGEKVKGIAILKGISTDRDGFVNSIEIQIDDGPWLAGSQIIPGWQAWNYYWDTTLYSNGVHTINAKCTDNGTMDSVIHSIKLTVDNGGNIPPMIEIKSHSDREIVEGMIYITGIASDLDGSIQCVEFQIDNESWQRVERTASDWTKWYFGLDTTIFHNGECVITVKVTDNQTAWTTDTIILQIENEESEVDEESEVFLPYWLLSLIIIAVLVAIIIILIIVFKSTHKRLEKIEKKLEKKKKKRPKEKPEPQKTKIEKPVEKKGEPAPDEYIDETIAEIEDLLGK